MDKSLKDTGVSEAADLTTQVTGSACGSYVPLEIQLGKRNLVCFGGLGAESSTRRLTSSVRRQSRTAALSVE